VSWKTE